MPVFIDKPIYKLGKLRVCRLVASTPEELFSFVETMGIRKRRVITKAALPYFELCRTERDRAIELGAIEVPWRALNTALATLARQQQPTPASHSACDH